LAENAGQLIKGLKDLYLWIILAAIGLILLCILFAAIVTRRKNDKAEEASHVIDVPIYRSPHSGPDGEASGVVDAPRFRSPHSGAAGETSMNDEILSGTEMTIPKKLLPVGTDFATDEGGMKSGNGEENLVNVTYDNEKKAGKSNNKDLDAEFDPTKKREEKVEKPDLFPLSNVAPVEREESTSVEKIEKNANLELQQAVERKRLMSAFNV
jgi:hypothetical protein